MMRYYEHGKHPGIRDAQHILESMGHELIVKSASGHAKYMGWEQHAYDYDIEKIIDPDHQEQYCKKLPNMNGYVTFYEPSSAVLYRPTGKPVIMVVPVRYEHPYSDKRPQWEELNRQLRQMYDDGQLKIVANSLYDKYWTEHFLVRKVTYIPSYCGYTGAKYTGEYKTWIVDQINEVIPTSDVLLDRRIAMPPGHTWEEVCRHAGVIMVPYNISQMSFYERYAWGMPIIVPGRRMLAELSKRNMALTQTHWVQPKDYGLEPPVRDMLEYADYCNLEEYPDLLVWESTKELVDMINNPPDLQQISANMHATNAKRLERIKEKWRTILQ